MGLKMLKMISIYIKKHLKITNSELYYGWGGAKFTNFTKLNPIPKQVAAFSEKNLSRPIV